jgi:putative transcriptional regulator
VAAPPLGDPNFDQSVVLLASHGEDGAFGWIINGRELMTLSELVVRADIQRDPPDIEGVVRIGGPVSQEHVWLLYPSAYRFDDVEEQLEVVEGVMASASRRVLEAIATGHAPPRMFALVGYAGWAPDQLESEIKVGAWLPTDVDPKLVFEVPRADIWANAYARIGANPFGFSSRTVGSA